ncbi:MAG: lipopolysaccharide biosynthesis protein [Mucilaginibacter sp.]
MENISNKMAKGAAWMVTFKLVERGIGLVSTIILARLLEPDDFGLVAMATAFLSLLTLLASFSFDVVLIQKQNADRSLYDTAWTFNVIFGFLLASALVISAIPLAQFYNEARLERILYVLAFSTFIGGFSNIGPVAFRKDLEFHKEFYFLLAKKLLAFTVCITLAFTLRNYWALVWGTFAGNMLALLLSYRVHPYRPRFCLSGGKELFGFSMWLFVNNVIYFTFYRAADFIISKTIGSHALGIYTIAYEFANLPTTELVAPINRAVLPGYSKMADDANAMRQGFLNVLSMIALCAIPAGLGIGLVAEPLVLVVLGEKWREAIPLIEILALSGTIMALQTNASVIYNALGKPKYMTAILFLQVFVFFIPMLILFLQTEGLLGAAKAYLLSNLFIWPINYYISIKLLNLRLLNIFWVMWRPAIAASAMLLLTENIISELKSTYIITNNIQFLISYITIGALIYCIFAISLWIISRRPEGAEKFLLKKLKVI